jgi:hypothetical protein
MPHEHAWTVGGHRTGRRMLQRHDRLPPRRGGECPPADLQELARGSALDTDACAATVDSAVWIKPEVPMDAVTIALFVVGVAMIGPRAGRSHRAAR